MTYRLTGMAAACALVISHSLFPAQAQAQTPPDAQAILAELRAMKQAYESRIATLENKLRGMEAAKSSGAQNAAAKPATTRTIRDNSFNPSIGIILNGKAASYSQDSSNIAGFGVGEEGERGKEGLSIDESELNFSANIDDKFYGSLTTAIVREGSEDKIELEEAYIQTLPDAGLPDGSRIKAGRAFWTLGYLNEHHAHADDFADRPLPYRAYLNKAYNDDGIEISYVLPTDFYSEIGGGIFRGDDFPFGGSTGGFDTFSAFARIGGGIGDNQSWRLGAYTLRGNATSRATGEGAVTFNGDTNLYAADLRYTWTPTGNAKNQELILQAEFFHRDEEGRYTDTGNSTGTVAYDEGSSGWYTQAVYKFAPSWRLGARYSELLAADVPAGLVGSALYQFL
ncbi:MAG: hypothetical protein O3B08_16785, partial [Proteobacteria bacterium]|nr:hypothetical protein [Pseudomonadota bacterium]